MPTFYDDNPHRSDRPARHDDPQPIGNTLRRLLNTDPAVDVLTALGGSRWTKAGRDRVYFTTEQLYTIAGGSISYFPNKPGVMSAWLPDFPDGRIGTTWAEVDGYYDVVEERWTLKGDPRLTFHLTRLLNTMLSTAITAAEADQAAADAEATEALAASRHAGDAVPLPSLPVVLDRCTPEQLRALAGAAVQIMGVLGHRTRWDPVEDMEDISARLQDARPRFLPAYDPNTAADKRWWCDLLGEDYGDDIQPGACGQCLEPTDEDPEARDGLCGRCADVEEAGHDA